MRRLSVLLLIMATQACQAAEVPRLGPQDAGLYVGMAGEYMFGQVPFAFSIDQVSRNSDPERLAAMVERLHANGKRSILDIFLYESPDEQAKPAGEYMAWLDPLLSRLPLDKVYAITLSEENIYWNGHEALLAELYGLVKAKYPTLSVYQWYSPGASPPGFGWPLLPADGWLIDEYCRPRELFENLVKKYTLLDRPLVHIAWAAPDWKEFSTWDKVWDDQLEICRRYGVPIAFFCWWPPDSTPPPPGNQSMWSWSAPPGTEHHRVWNEMVLPYVERLRQGIGDPQGADRSTGRPIPVAGDETGRFTYHEDFRSSPRFVDDADIEGFTGLRWTGKRLETKAGRAATLTYRLGSPFALHEVQAAVKGEMVDGAVTLSLSADGEAWTSQSSLGSAVSAALAETAGQELRGAWVRIELRSDQGALAGIDDLQISARVDPPTVPQVVLTPSANGTVSFTDDFRSQLYLHVGKVTNPPEIRWVPGAIRMFGKQGFANEASVEYHFVCSRPLRDAAVQLTCAADKANFGALVELSASLDGQTYSPVVATDADGKTSFSGDLMLRPELGEGVAELWVRVRLLNTCGVATKQASPSVSRLTLTGRS